MKGKLKSNIYLENMFGILQFSRRETIGVKGIRFQSICKSCVCVVNTNIKSFTDRWAKINPETHELMEILGTVGNYHTESDVIKRWCDILPCKYPSYHIKKENIFTKYPYIEAFTVDNEHTKDMDDALTVRTLENGDIQLGIHIIDVVPFLKDHLSQFDRDTVIESIQNRISSAYFDDDSVPMFPCHIAHNLLSIVPDTKRQVITLWLDFDCNYIVKAHYWKSEIIMNTAKLTYESFKQKKPNEYRILSKITKTTEPHDIIAWTMITYNILFAQDYLQEKGILRSKQEDKSAEYVMKDSTKQQTHSEMGKIYTHATSPIRRFVDIYNQMIYHNEEFISVDIDTINERVSTISKFHKQHAILELSHKTRSKPVLVNIYSKNKETVVVEYKKQRFRIPRYDTFYEGHFQESEDTVELWGILKNGRSSLRIKNTHEDIVSNECVDTKPYDIDSVQYADLTKEDVEECMGYPLDSFQKGCLKVINNNEDLFGTAPTGSGKTTVAMMGILKAFNSGKRVIFSSPIKALSNEKYSDMKKRLNGRVSLLTGDMKVRCTPPGGDGSPELLIMTAEILRNKLNQPDDPDVRDVIMVVIDECHYINDADRGPVWEETLLLLPKHIHVVALSATLSAPEDFCKWLSNRRPTRCVQHHERHVPLYFGSFVNERFTEMTNTNQIREGKGVANDLYHWKHPSKMSDAPVQLVKQLMQNDMCPAIVFCMSRNRCVQMAESFTENLMVSKRPYKHTKEHRFDELVYEANLKDWNDEVLSHKRKFQIYVKKYLKPWRAQLEKLPEYNYFIDMLYKGVAYHHSGMIPVLKEFVEILFRDKMIVAVFATESLGVGIDMPARTVVFTQMNKPGDNGFRNLYTHEFMQMAGRAGRRGKDTKGYVVYYPYPPGKGGITYAEFNHMVMGKPPRAESQLRITPDFVIRNYLKGYHHMNGSLLGHGIHKEIVANESTFNNKNKNKDTIMQIGELENKLKGSGFNCNVFVSLNKKQIKTIKNEVKQLLDSVSMSVDDAMLMYEHYKNIDNMTNYMYNEWTQVVDTLQQNNFIIQNDLSMMGKVASLMCDGLPLVRASLMVSERFEQLSITDIISWLGIFGWSMKDNDEQVDNGVTELSDELKQLLQYTGEYSVYLYDKELKNIYYKGSIMNDWMRNKNVEQIVQYVGLAEFGNFIKTILRVSSFIEEFRTIFLGMEKYELYNKFENYEERLFYGIVSNASIYVNN